MYNKEELVELLDNDSEVVLFNKDIFANLQVPEEVLNIMVNIGLPESASPYITFYRMGKGGGELLSCFYNIQSYLDSEEYNNEELNDIWKEFAQYIVLGNVENDTIILNEKFRVIRIDHETLYETYINKSLECFMQSIVRYNKMIKSVLKRYDVLVYFDDVVTLDDINSLERELLAIDNSAVEEDCFWYIELEELRQNIVDR